MFRSNLYDFLSSVEHKIRYFEGSKQYWTLLTFITVYGEKNTKNIFFCVVLKYLQVT